MMSKKEQHFSVYDTATPHIYAQASSTSIKTDELINLKKATRSIAIMPQSELIEYSFDIEKGLPLEELYETVELKMYQEAALDHNHEYKIDYCYHDSKIDSHNLTIHAVAVPLQNLNSIFEENIKYSMYLDIITTYNALPKVLYDTDILNPSEDLFIYLGRSGSTLTLYAEGEYVYSKSDDNTLQSLYESFIQISGENFDYLEFTSLLTKKGLDESLYDHESKPLYIDLKQTIENYISTLNNRIIYARRIGGLHTLSRIYLGSEAGVIPGIKALLEEYTGVTSHDYHFFTDFYLKGDPYVDQQKLLALLSAYHYEQSDFKPLYNLSVFPRPDMFIKRPAGQMLILSTLALILLLSLPIFSFISGSWMEHRTKQLLETLNFSQSEFERFRVSEDESLKTHKGLEAQLHQEHKTLLEHKKFLNKLIKHRSLQKKKLTFLYQLLNKINQNRVLITKLVIKKNTIGLSVYSKKESSLTSLLRDFIKIKELKVKMSNISYNKQNFRYSTSFDLKIKQ